jgi:hypothetical protein
MGRNHIADGTGMAVAVNQGIVKISGNQNLDRIIKLFFVFHFVNDRELENSMLYHFQVSGGDGVYYYFFALPANKLLSGEG